MDSALAAHPAALGLILGIPKIFLLMLLKRIESTAQKSGQRLDSVNRTRQVMASGKLVLQKYY